MSKKIPQTRFREIVARLGGQVKVARLAAVTQSAVSGWCCGRSNPPLAAAAAIARAAGVTVEWLMGEDDLAAPGGRAIPEPLSYQRQCSCGCGAFVLEAYRRGRAA